MTMYVPLLQMAACEAVVRLVFDFTSTCVTFWMEFGFTFADSQMKDMF